MRRATGFRALGMAVVALAASCGGDDNSTPTAPSAPVVNEQFSGTLSPSGSVDHPFRVSAAGQVVVVLNRLAPDPAVNLSVAIGTWNGTTCSIVWTNPNARPGPTLLSGNAQTGDFCVRVADTGRLPADSTVSYTVQVNHS